jgi:hypothetical protein
MNQKKQGGEEKIFNILILTLEEMSHPLAARHDRRKANVARLRYVEAIPRPVGLGMTVK